MGDRNAVGVIVDRHSLLYVVTRWGADSHYDVVANVLRRSARNVLKDGGCLLREVLMETATGFEIHRDFWRDNDGLFITTVPQIDLDHPVLVLDPHKEEVEEWESVAKPGNVRRWSFHDFASIQPKEKSNEEKQK